MWGFLERVSVADMVLVIGVLTFTGAVALWFVARSLRFEFFDRCGSGGGHVTCSETLSWAKTCTDGGTQFELHTQCFNPWCGAMNIARWEHSSRGVIDL